jgi:hypothetical protein
VVHDWWKPFRDATEAGFEELYADGEITKKLRSLLRVILSPDYRESWK